MNDAEIKVLLHEAIEEISKAQLENIEEAITNHSRSDDHIAIKMFINKERRRQEMWDKITTSALGAIIIGTLVWVGSHALDFIAYLVKTKGS